MENEEYGLILLLFISLPNIIVLIIALLAMKEYNKGLKFFALFFLGGVT